jgi:hypothetical protein
VSDQAHFDEHQFYKHHANIVDAVYDGHEFQSTGISWDDRRSMHVEKRAVVPGQRITPDWVFNDAKLRAVVVHCVEQRAYMWLGHRRQGSEDERLALAKKYLEAVKASRISTLDHLAKIHAQMKRSLGDDPAVSKAAQKVVEIDTKLVNDEKPELLYVGVACHCWRLNENSAQAGVALGIKPTLVRQILWRMRRAAGRLGYGPVMVTRRKQSGGRSLAIGRACVRPSRRTRLIPREKRLPLVIKLHTAGYGTNDIRMALGWRADSNDGYGMVKRLMIKAGLRRP